jgi:hypothetical protein
MGSVLSFSVKRKYRPALRKSVMSDNDPETIIPVSVILAAADISETPT